MSRKTYARFVRDVPVVRPDVTRKLWKVRGRYIASSASSCWVREVYLFPSNADGDLVDLMELPGSTPDTLDHEVAIRNAGWEPKYD